MKASACVRIGFTVGVWIVADGMSIVYWPDG